MTAAGLSGARLRADASLSLRSWLAALYARYPFHSRRSTNDRSPPNCPVHGRGLLRPLNVDSGRWRWNKRRGATGTGRAGWRSGRIQKSGRGNTASLGPNFQMGRSTRVDDVLEVALRPSVRTGGKLFDVRAFSIKDAGTLSLEPRL